MKAVNFRKLIKLDVITINTRLNVNPWQRTKLLKKDSYEYKSQ